MLSVLAGSVVCSRRRPAQRRGAGRRRSASARSRSPRATSWPRSRPRSSSRSARRASSGTWGSAAPASRIARSSPGAIDLYPEYTGTLGRVILKDASLATVGGHPRPPLAARGLTISASLGFANTYALAVRAATWRSASGSRTIGDLARHPELTAAFSSGFLEREDGWPGLRAPLRPRAGARGGDGARAHVSRARERRGRRHGRLLDGRPARAAAAPPARGRPALLPRLLGGAAGAPRASSSGIPRTWARLREVLEGRHRRPAHGPR